MYPTCHTQVVTEAKDYDNSLFIILEGRLEYSVQVLLITSPLGSSIVLRFLPLLPEVTYLRACSALILQLLPLDLISQQTRTPFEV